MARSRHSLASIVCTGCGQHDDVNFNAAKNILCKSGAVADTRKTLSEPGNRARMSKGHVASSCADLSHDFRSVETAEDSTLPTPCSGVDRGGLRNVG